MKALHYPGKPQKALSASKREAQAQASSKWVAPAQASTVLGDSLMDRTEVMVEDGRLAAQFGAGSQSEL